MRPWPGTPYPLGATYDGVGTNFALFSEVAEAVELCLFDEEGNETRARLPEVDGFVHHGYLLGIGPGQRYGYRVHGPHDPERGLRCNPNKLLIDPYAKAVSHGVDWDESLFGYNFDSPEERNDADSAGHVPYSLVVSPFFDWANDRPPKTPYNESVIYEAHVKGLTMTHPEIPDRLRGTRAALATLVQLAHHDLEGARSYLLLIPRRAVPIRLFCVLPLLFAYATLRDLTQVPQALARRDVVKISRREVKSLTLMGFLVILSNRGLAWLADRAMQRMTKEPVQQMPRT